MTRQELRIFLDAHYCGCGRPEDASASLMRLLATFDKMRDQKPGEYAYQTLPKWIPDSGIMFLMLYWLDRLNLIEHGGGVLASWLTSDGEDLLAALRAEAGDEFEALHEMHCAHGEDVSAPCKECGK